MNESTTLFVLILGSLIAFLAALYLVYTALFANRTVAEKESEVTEEMPTSK